MEREYPMAKGLTAKGWTILEGILARANSEQIKIIMQKCLNHLPEENATIIFNCKTVINSVIKEFRCSLCDKICPDEKGDSKAISEDISIKICDHCMFIATNWEKMKEAQ